MQFIATNSFDSNGNFIVNITRSSTMQQTFYLLQEQ